MTKAEFEVLSGFEKAEALNKYGCFLDDRIVGSGRMYLYAVNYFYVELFYEFGSLNGRGVSVNRVFEEVDFLEEYLSHVDISFIYS